MEDNIKIYALISRYNHQMQNYIFVCCKSSYKLTVSAQLLFYPTNIYLIDNICSRGDIECP